MKNRTIKNPGQFNIVATTEIIKDLAENIIGDKGKVISIISSSLDPHSYKTTLNDAHLILNAKIILKNGLHLEGSLDHDLEKLGQQKKRNVFSMDNALDKNDILHAKGFSGGPDPHFWFDVKLWAKIARHITEKIKEADPDKNNHAYYDQRLATYLVRLTNLDIDVQEFIKKIPKEKRIICMPHNAFGYLEKYGLQTKSLQGISTVTEPSCKTRSDLVNMIITNGIKAIFLESANNNKIMYAIQADCQKRGHQVTCHLVYTDALAQKGPANTYEGMIRHNLSTFANALKR